MFPSRLYRLIPASLTPSKGVSCIRSLVDPDRQRLSELSSSSIPRNFYEGLYLNIFRGEPAISGFDRHITPNHKSSHVISPTTSSGLLHSLRRNSPCSWLAHPVSGHSNGTMNTLFRFAFAQSPPDL